MYLIWAHSHPVGDVLLAMWVHCAPMLEARKSLGHSLRRVLMPIRANTTKPTKSFEVSAAATYAECLTLVVSPCWATWGLQWLAKLAVVHERTRPSITRLLQE